MEDSYYIILDTHQKEIILYVIHYVNGEIFDSFYAISSGMFQLDCPYTQLLAEYNCLILNLKVTSVHCYS